MDVDDPIEVAGPSHSPRQSPAEPPCNSAKGSKVKANELAEKLAAHEEMYQEIVKVLEREDGKLNERRKQAGGSRDVSGDRFLCGETSGEVDVPSPGWCIANFETGKGRGLPEPVVRTAGFCGSPSLGQGCIPAEKGGYIGRVWHFKQLSPWTRF